MRREVERFREVVRAIQRGGPPLCYDSCHDGDSVRCGWCGAGAEGWFTFEGGRQSIETKTPVAHDEDCPWLLAARCETVSDVVSDVDRLACAIALDRAYALAMAERPTAASCQECGYPAVRVLFDAHGNCLGNAYCAKCVSPAEVVGSSLVYRDFKCRKAIELLVQTSRGESEGSTGFPGQCSPRAAYVVPVPFREGYRVALPNIWAGPIEINEEEAQALYEALSAVLTK